MTFTRCLEKWICDNYPTIGVWYPKIGPSFKYNNMDFPGDVYVHWAKDGRSADWSNHVPTSILGNAGIIAKYNIRVDEDDNIYLKWTRRPFHPDVTETVFNPASPDFFDQLKTELDEIIVERDADDCR